MFFNQHQHLQCKVNAVTPRMIHILFTCPDLFLLTNTKPISIQVATTSLHDVAFLASLLNYIFTFYYYYFLLFFLS